MGLLDGILGNKVVKDLAFGQIKKIFKEGNVDFIVLRLDHNGEIVVELYEPGDAVVVSQKSESGPKMEVVKP